MEAITLLKKHQLRKTTHRLEILELFLDKPEPISQRDLQIKFPDCDRVTIYRILNSFQEKGLIHRIVDTDNVVRYAFSKPQEETHHHEHVHFKCENCGKISCLADITPENFPLPEGYTIRNINFLVIGTCKKCNQ